MNQKPTWLKAAALVSSIVLFSGYVWYRATASPPYAKPATPSESGNVNTADAEGFVGSQHGSTMPVSKPQAPAPRELTTRGALLPGSKRGDIEAIPLSAQAPEVTPRIFLPGSKSGGFRETITPPEEARQEIRARILLPGSKAGGFEEITPSAPRQARPAPKVQKQ